MAQVGRTFTGHRTEKMLCTQHTYNQTNFLWVRHSQGGGWTQTPRLPQCGGVAFPEVSLGWDLIFVRTTHFFPCSIIFSVFSTATSLGLSCNLCSSSSMWLLWLPVLMSQCSAHFYYCTSAMESIRTTKNTLQALVCVWMETQDAYNV